MGLRLFSANEKKFGTMSYPEFLVPIYGIAEETLSYTILMEPSDAILGEVVFSDKFSTMRKSWNEFTRFQLASMCLLQVRRLHALDFVHRDVQTFAFLA